MYRILSIIGKYAKCYLKLILLRVRLCNWKINGVIKSKLYGGSTFIDSIKKLDKQMVLPAMRILNAKIGKNCDIETGITFHNCTDFSRLEIGSNVHIGKNCFFDLRDKIVIGSNCTISMGTTIITHQDMGKSNLNILYPSTKKEVIIGDNVYVGANSTILMGTVIGNETIIAAGSLVKGVLKSNSIYAGIPAKWIRSTKASTI